MSNLTVCVNGITFSNPILAASGTVGFGRELSQIIPLTCLGGLVSKAVTVSPRIGNLAPRICETPQGMLNSVGLENPGLKRFQNEVLPGFSQLECKKFINLAGHNLEEYVLIAKELSLAEVDGFELNLSCPNVSDGLAFGTSPLMIEQVTQAVRQVTDKPLWVKLTPNVTSISDCAKAAEAGGADGVSLINTLLAMAIDVRTRRPVLHNNTGGLSGPAVKPIALRMVHEVYRAIKLPIVGLGGITRAEDVVEFLLAGASLVQVGTLVLTDPFKVAKLSHELDELLDNLGVQTPSELTGQLKAW